MNDSIPSLHLFVSYQRKDVAIATTLAGDLIAEGFSVFIDQGIQVGEAWDERLETALKQSFAVVALWSPNSVASRWVRREARFGLRREMLLPILLSTCEIPVEFSDVECADFRSRCPGDRMHVEWLNLVRSLALLHAASKTPKISHSARIYFELGNRFSSGDRCPANPQIALEWYSKALAEGHPTAAARIDELSG